MKRFAVVGAAIAAAWGSAAAATPPPAATYYIQFNGQDQFDAAPGSYSAPGATVTFATGPSPSIYVTANGTSVTAGMTYYFRIDGPENVIVPIRVLGALRVSSTAADDAQANAFDEIKVTTPFNSPTANLEHDVGGFNNGGATSANPLLTASTYTNSDTAIRLIAGVNSRNGRDGPGFGTSFADPIVSIDPSFASFDPDYLKHYTLEFAPGIGNAAAGAGVPEPASWALMTTGFGALGALLRRRQKAPSITA